MSESPSSKRPLRSIAKVPVIGYFAELTWYWLTLPRHFKTLFAGLKQLTEEATAAKLTDIRLNENQAKLEQELQAAKESQANIANQLADMRHQLLLLHDTAAPAATNSSPATTSLFADEHALDKFYIDFENNFRGTEAEIKARQQIYVTYFKKFKTDYKKYPVLDIGCGRGEMLAVLKENNIQAIGIDLNKSMVERAKELGYNVVQAEALDYLKKQKTGSISAITGYHIAEHIPFDMLIRILEESYRVLRPGGFIIFETPNPENLNVGAFSFYYDPSHLHPLPPDLLSFSVKNRGFDKVEILRLHPKSPPAKTAKNDAFTREVSGKLFGPQDYAVIGYKL